MLCWSPSFFLTCITYGGLLHICPYVITQVLCWSPSFFLSFVLHMPITHLYWYVISAVLHMGVCPVLKCSLDSWEQFFCLNGKQVGPPPLLVLIILPNLQCTSACHQSYRLLGRVSQSTVPTKRQGISPWYKPCTNRNCRGVWHSHSDHQSGVPSHIHRTPSWNSSWNPSWNPSSLYPVQVGKVALEVHVRNNRWLLCKPM